MVSHARALHIAALTMLAAAALPAQDVIQVGDPKAAAGPPTVSLSQPTVRQVPNRYVIRFVPGTPALERANEAASIGARVLHNFAFSSSIVVELPNENALQGLSRSRNVLEVQPDVYAQIMAKPGTGTPRAPNNLEAAVSGADVSLVWNDRANDEDGYLVRRCQGPSCTPANIATLPANSASYADSGLADGTYRYEVAAFRASFVSDPSNTVDATVSNGGPPPPPPPPPPGDPLVRGTRQVLSYAVQRVGRPVAGSTGQGIGVAVIDTGFDYTHADLAPAADLPGTVDPVAQTATGTSFNAVAPGDSCQDIFGHGTHVAGLLGAVDNNMGIVGVAPQSAMYCTKIGDSELIPLTNVQAALEWVLLRHDQVSPPIRVVNMSLGSPVSGSATQAAIADLIQQLYAAGVVTVAAAGNDPNVEVDSIFPASVPNVISVAGTTATDGLSTCSGSPGWVMADTPFVGTTDGSGVTISAPGSEREDIIPGSIGCTALLYGVLSTSMIVPDGPPTPAPITRKVPIPTGAIEARGTSFAAPLVSGVVARILEQELLIGPLSGTSADVDNARATLVNTADRVGEAPLDHPWGGIIIVWDFDGVREGIAQAPMPAP